MMGRVERRFSRLLSQRKKAFIPFFTAFYPSWDKFKQILFAASEIGADFIEIGIPYSDPLADGKTIQYSSIRAFEQGFSYKSFLKNMTGLRDELKSSLILMSYFNTVLQRGIERFGEDMIEMGIDGVIIPDLPYEESLLVNSIFQRQEIDLIPLVAPTTKEERLKLICSRCQSFVYLVSLTGVTGTRSTLPDGIKEYVKRVRRLTSLPLCVGFGISNGYQAKSMAEICDGVIVGSALIDILKGSEDEPDVMNKLAALMAELRNAINSDNLSVLTKNK
jgi:tryptophan synthase alpha chain